jgi:hypothetical protein
VRGRPRKYKTEEEAKAARLASRRRYNKKVTARDPGHKIGRVNLGGKWLNEREQQASYARRVHPNAAEKWAEGLARMIEKKESE